MKNTVPINIGPNTRFVISTSGRISSLKRYQILLQEHLQLDVAYIPISAVNVDGLIRPESFVGTLRSLPCLGGAISKDIKFKVIPFLDGLDSSARQVNSVNTVVCRNGSLFGYNTDVLGFEYAIRQGITEAKRKIASAVIYGYGGVFGVACNVLKKLGIEVFVTGRNPQSIERCAAEYGIGKFTGGPCDLFVNAAPVSSDNLEQVPGFLQALRGCALVFDHHMPGTALAEYCTKENIFYIPGTAMYYPQMCKQWELFLGDRINPAELPALIEKAERMAKG